MTFAPDDNSLSSDQNTNQFLVQARIESQISYIIIKNFTSWANVETWKHEIPSVTLKMVGFPWVFDPHPIIKSMDVNFLKKKKKRSMDFK